MHWKVWGEIIIHPQTSTAIYCILKFTQVDMYSVKTAMLLPCTPDSKVHGSYMGPTRVLSAPDGLHVVPMNLAIRGYFQNTQVTTHVIDAPALSTLNNRRVWPLKLDQHLRQLGFKPHWMQVVWQHYCFSQGIASIRFHQPVPLFTSIKINQSIQFNYR